MLLLLLLLFYFCFLFVFFFLINVVFISQSNSHSLSTPFYLDKQTCLQRVVCLFAYIISNKIPSENDYVPLTGYHQSNRCGASKSHYRY